MLRISAKTRKFSLSLVLVLSLVTLIFPSSLVASATSSANAEANSGVGAKTIGYIIPAGTIQALIFDPEAQGPMKELVFVFGGNQDALRIRRVIESPIGEDIEFAGATPLDASRFFLRNPMPLWSDSVFVVYVENLGDNDQHLQITARWK